MAKEINSLWGQFMESYQGSAVIAEDKCSIKVANGSKTVF